MGNENHRNNLVLDEDVLALAKNILTEGISIFNHNKIIDYLQVISKQIDKTKNLQVNAIFILSVKKYSKDYPLIDLMVNNVENSLLLDFLFLTDNGNSCNRDNGDNFSDYSPQEVENIFSGFIGEGLNNEMQ